MFQTNWNWIIAGNYVFFSFNFEFFFRWNQKSDNANNHNCQTDTHTAAEHTRPFQLRILLYLTRRNAGSHFWGQIHYQRYLSLSPISTKKIPTFSFNLHTIFVVENSEKFFTGQYLYRSSASDTVFNSKIVFWSVKCVRIKLKWYDCFARNRSIDLVRHSSENKQTTEHRRKKRITLRTSTFTHRTANENNCLKWIIRTRTQSAILTRRITNQCWFSRVSLPHSLCVCYSQVKTQNILLNLHEPIEKPLQFAHWMNRLFIWFLHFCDAAKFQEGLTPFCHHSCYSSLS